LGGEKDQNRREMLSGFSPGPVLALEVTTSFACSHGPCEPTSISFRDEFLPLQCRLIVVFSLVRALGQLDLGPHYFPDRDFVEDVGNAIEPRSPLVIGAHDEPGRVFGVGHF
jgi:hypothetical protein